MNRKKSIGPTNYIFSWAVNERILIKWAQIWAALIFIQLSAELSASAIFPEERERELSAKYLWATNALYSSLLLVAYMGEKVEKLVWKMWQQKYYGQISLVSLRIFLQSVK